MSICCLLLVANYVGRVLYANNIGQLLYAVLPHRRSVSIYTLCFPLPWVKTQSTATAYR